MHMDEKRSEKDLVRDDWLGKAGYRVLRFSANEVMNAWSNCAERILSEVRQAN